MLLRPTLKAHSFDLFSIVWFSNSQIAQESITPNGSVFPTIRHCIRLLLTLPCIRRVSAAKFEAVADVRVAEQED